ncbi:MAG: hypothetical protein ACE5FS_03510 [Paracoccaceae bacterium]
MLSPAEKRLWLALNRQRVVTYDDALDVIVGDKDINSATPKYAQIFAHRMRAKNYRIRTIHGVGLTVAEPEGDFLDRDLRLIRKDGRWQNIPTLEFRALSVLGPNKTPAWRVQSAICAGSKTENPYRLRMTVMCKLKKTLEGTGHGIEQSNDSETRDVEWYRLVGTPAPKPEKLTPTEFFLWEAMRLHILVPYKRAFLEIGSDSMAYLSCLLYRMRKKGYPARAVYGEGITAVRDTLRKAPPQVLDALGLFSGGLVPGSIILEKMAERARGPLGRSNRQTLMSRLKAAVEGGGDRLEWSGPTRPIEDRVYRITK